MDRDTQLEYATELNKKIKFLKETGALRTEDISDGYHTIGELYDHRVTLYIALCNKLADPRTYPIYEVWRSKLHHDGTMFDGMFILGIGLKAGEQITYHLNMEWWDKTDFAATLDKAPVYDGHSSNDVLERLFETIGGFKRSRIGHLKV